MCSVGSPPGMWLRTTGLTDIFFFFFFFDALFCFFLNFPGWVDIKYNTLEHNPTSKRL